VGRRRSRLAAAVAGALLVLPAAAPAQEGAAEQARRADALLSELLRDEGNEELLRRAAVLREDCLAAGNYRTAELVAGQLVARRPSSLADHHRYIRILLARGEREHARENLEGLIRDIPSDCTAYRMQAEMHASLGEARKALEVHARHHKEHPGEAGAPYAMASLALRDLRDYDAARAAIAALRTVGKAPAASPETAAFCRENADLLAAEAADAGRQAEVLRVHARRLDRMIAGALAATLGALLAGAWLTRRR